MPIPMKKEYNRNIYDYQSAYSFGNKAVTPLQPRPQVRKKVVQKTIQPAKKIKKTKKVGFFKKLANFISRLVSLTILCAMAYYSLPFTFHRVSKPLFNGGNYKNITMDYYNLAFPTVNYLSNDYFLGHRALAKSSKKGSMTPIYKSDRMIGLESSLQALAQKFPTIEPSVFVWDFESGKYASLNSEKTYSAASIIKIPVLINLYKQIELGKMSINDKMTLTDYYKASGSGNMQYASTGNEYTLDELARVMITDSDNSATNMLIAKTGSMTNVNQAIRDWGLKSTYVSSWLPDLSGTNYTTAEDMATMLYNLDNPGFLTINSREYMIDYMSHVKNNRLIQAGLPADAIFIHKTGDIGKMLGDAGIVYMPSGKRYIVVILANRPYNSPLGKDFIQAASKMIYTEFEKTK